MTPLERLTALTSDPQDGGKWIIGRKPSHYKRLSVSAEEADRLAFEGASACVATFGTVLHYTQAMIFGAMISAGYDTVIACTPSQYGKSFTLARGGLYMAFHGEKLAVSGATSDVTAIIMQHARQALRTADEEVRTALAPDTKKKIDKLDVSIRRDRLGFVSGGYMEALTLGDTFEGVSHNKAVGRGQSYIVDEASFVSSEALAEIGRRDFSRLDGKKDKLIMISNPHRAGRFYDLLTGDADERTLIVWMDALTAIEEGRVTREQVLTSDFAKVPDTCLRYLLCELPDESAGMFNIPKVETFDGGISFLGVDSAYKGQDDIRVCHLTLGGGKFHAKEIAKIDKSRWVDGKTGEDVVLAVARAVKRTDAKLVCVDTGQGIWLQEGLRRYGIPSIGINFGAGPTKARVSNNEYSATNAVNLRAEMHLDVQDLIDKDRLTVSEQAYMEIKDVLPLVSMERKSNGKVLIKDKAKIKAVLGKSPDGFDALLLAVHAGVLYIRENFTFITE